jgi:hypothetical protein
VIRKSSYSNHDVSRNNRWFLLERSTILLMTGFEFLQFVPSFSKDPLAALHFLLPGKTRSTSAIWSLFIIAPLE